MNDDNLTEVILPSGITAFLSAELTYGQHRKLQAILYNTVDPNAAFKEAGGKKESNVTGQLMMDYYMMKMIIATKKLIGLDDKEIPVSEEAIEALSMKDGEALNDAVDKLFEETKKK